MSSHDSLTPAQSRLYDDVTGIAGYDGSDCKDVLDHLDAPPQDKAAVAEVLGGPGAGAEYLTADSPQPTHNVAQRRVEELAERCERAAAQLAADAADPAGTLAERGFHLSDTETAAFGARHQAAADAASRYAAQLREQVAVGEPLSDTQVAQAEKVAQAAELGGILIDGSRLDSAAAERSVASDEERQAIRDYRQEKQDAIEGSGMFEHVAETINGVEQVPYWQLGHVQQPQDTVASTGDDADEA